jgi:hypothetical protein
LIYSVNNQTTIPKATCEKMKGCLAVLALLATSVVVGAELLGGGVVTLMGGGVVTLMGAGVMQSSELTL